MKKVFLSVTFALAMVIGANAQTQTPAPAANPNQAEIQFEETMHDFGNIKEGTMATYEFKFKNIGKETLVLSNVQASCGCTTPTWTREPVAPGKTGVITATFNSSGRPGVFNKVVTVTSNAKSASVPLTLKGFVETAPAQPASPVINNPVQPKP